MAKYYHDEMSRLLLIGRAWGIASEKNMYDIYIDRLTREDLLEMLQGPNGEEHAQRLNRMNEGYKDIIEIFTEVVPCRDEENELD